MKKILYLSVYWALQLTWGCLQTLAGLLIFLRYLNRPHRLFHGAVQTKWDAPDLGLSLGLFVFTPNDEQEVYGPAAESIRESVHALAVHEYGHTLQSLIMGPFYLIVLVSSMSWAGLPGYRRMRERGIRSYSDWWCERWANALGEKATGARSIGYYERLRQKR